MSISSGVRRKLWAASGGYCGNPACHKDLLQTSMMIDTILLSVDEEVEMCFLENAKHLEF